MDKRLQDIHIIIGDEEVFGIRAIDLLEFVKRPNSFLFRYRATSIQEYQLLIPILPHMQIIIDWKENLWGLVKLAIITQKEMEWCIVIYRISIHLWSS